MKAPAHLGLAEGLHALEGLGVGYADVLGATRVLEPRVLGPHARVVEASRDAVCLLDLPVLVLSSKKVLGGHTRCWKGRDAVQILDLPILVLPTKQGVGRTVLPPKWCWNAKVL